MNSSFEVLEDEYPIIWHEPDCELASKIDKKIHVFCDFQEIVSFAESLKTSFLLIVPNERVKSLSHDYYVRRLADFEEKTILKGFDVQDDRKIYVYYTDEDFESEVFVEENAMKWDVKEVAKGFREELIFWERKRRGLEDRDAVFKRSENSQRFDLLENLCDLWTFGDEEDIFRECKGFCIKSLKEFVKKRKQEKKKLIYYVNLGECCFQLGEDQKALEFYTKACDIVEQVYGEMHPNVGSLYEALFKIYRRIGRKEKAIEYGLKAVQIKKSIYEEKNERDQTFFRNVGNVCSWSGQFEKAIDCYLNAVEIKKSGSKQPDIALHFLYSDIAKAYRNIKDFAKALEYHQKSLETQKLIYGEINAFTRSSYNDIGMMFKEIGEYQEAGKYLEKALVI